MVRDVYDYVVVGAGSAGCVLANRLSASGKYRVLVLEAGGRDTNPWIHIPVGYYRTMFDRRISWCFETEPEPSSGNRAMIWPRGKVLGGSSSINGLVYIRGQPQDYDHWRQFGNAGWGWDDVLPYFKMAEDQQRGGDDLHGQGGPLAVSDITEHREICEAYIAAAQQAGIPRNDDFNGPSQEGVGYYQLTIRKGRRCSAAVAYLHPARRRANLRVDVGAMATGITVEDGRAVGVTYRHNGVDRTALADGEVILAGGAINSPQLLQLSGIGPADRLRDHGIDVRHDLPGVGANLQDHYQVRMQHRCIRPITLNDDMHSLSRKVRIAVEYAVRRTGPITSGAPQVGLFTRTRDELASPDIQFHFMPLSADKAGDPLHRHPGITSSICQLRPESRGTVEIRSSDPLAAPLIRPNYLTTEGDVQTFVRALRLGRKIVAAPAMAAHVAEELSPGADVQSDEELIAYARASGGTIFHPVGTCKMGADPNAVVDSRLRVHGIGRLRVIDCSIMPTLVSGNTNAAAIMIGEKGAAMILEDAA